VSDEAFRLYVCPCCFTADLAPGVCSECGHTRAECDPGDPNNPCRKPPMDAAGNITSRAPLWWLMRSAPYLRKKIEQQTNP